MAFTVPRARKCPKCGTGVQTFSHEHGPSNIADARNWYYECPSCGYKREKWVEDLSPQLVSE